MVLKQVGIVERTLREVQQRQSAREYELLDAEQRPREFIQRELQQCNRMYGPFGGGLQLQDKNANGRPGRRPVSFVSDSPSGGTQRVEIPVYLDRREIARAVSDELGSRGRLPPSSSRGFDGRMSPAFSGGTLST